METTRTISLLFLALLGGCTSMSDARPRANLTVPAEDVIRTIKKDLDNYARYEVSTAADAPLPNACRGQVNLHVAAVTVSLTTLTERSQSGEVGVEVPIGGIALGASGSGSKTRTNSQALTFTLVPAVNAASVAPPPEPEAGSFYGVLRGLRESLLRASDTTPCLRFPDDKQDNTIEFGFTVTKEQGMGGKISFLIFSLGAERKSSEAVGNTITVSFVGEGQSMMPH
jgi:hypothetical protein